MRAAGFITENNVIPKEKINLQTKDKNNITYKEYSEYIKKNYNFYTEIYWVKIEDMRCHLMQIEILTDDFMKKCIISIPYLLQKGVCI